MHVEVLCFGSMARGIAEIGDVPPPLYPSGITGASQVFFKKENYELGKGNEKNLTFVFVWLTATNE